MHTAQTLHHLAIVPDGNRRWTAQHKMQDAITYDIGGELLIKILQTAFDLKVGCVSLWIGSYANLTTRSTQAPILRRLYAQRFNELAKHPFVHKHHIHVQVLGEWRDVVGKAASQAIERALDATKNYTNGTLAIFVGYDGKRERGAALQNLVANNAFANIPADPAEAAQLLHRYSWSAALPPVDLVVRTGCHADPHNSAGFLSMLADNAQYAFPDVLWPDFRPQMLEKIIEDFLGRERRMGS